MVAFPHLLDLLINHLEFLQEIIRCLFQGGAVSLDETLIFAISFTIGTVTHRLVVQCQGIFIGCSILTQIDRIIQGLFQKVIRIL